MKFETNWVNSVYPEAVKLDESTVHYKARFGSFRVDGATYTVNDMYVIKPSTHTYVGSGMPMEINIKGSGPRGGATIVIFVELMEMDLFDTFFYTIGFGEGETSEQPVGVPRQFFEGVSLDLAIPTPQEGETLFHYYGNSLFDSCESQLILISKTTIYINGEQMKELAYKKSNYVLNPMKIVVKDTKKCPKNETEPPTNNTPPRNDTISTPPKNNTPVSPPKERPEDPEDIPKFDPNIFNQTYDPYPPPKENQPPQETEDYPSEDFPYPDTWYWTGEPNYPNDPFYPEYIFPPQPIFSWWPDPWWPVWFNNYLPDQWPQEYWPEGYYPGSRNPWWPNDPFPPLMPFDTFYNDPWFPD